MDRIKRFLIFAYILPSLERGKGRSTSVQKGTNAAVCHTGRDRGRHTRLGGAKREVIITSPITTTVLEDARITLIYEPLSPRMVIPDVVTRILNTTKRSGGILAVTDLVTPSRILNTISGILRCPIDRKRILGGMFRIWGDGSRIIIMNEAIVRPPKGGRPTF
jgi:hypothetical protein